MTFFSSDINEQNKVPQEIEADRLRWSSLNLIICRHILPKFRPMRARELCENRPDPFPSDGLLLFRFFCVTWLQLDLLERPGFAPVN